MLPTVTDNMRGLDRILLMPFLLSSLLTVTIAGISGEIASNDQNATSSYYDPNFSLPAGERYVTLAGIAYCTNPLFTKDTVETWTCQACKKYPNVVATSFHGSKTDANGYVGYDSDAKEIIVSFSGTDPLSIQNWIDDLDFIQISYPLCANVDCKVHKGFYDTYLSVNDKVKSLVDFYIDKYPNFKQISVTGHSLGAALAAHCTADLVSLNYTVSTTYTYGMPRVGNQAFEEWYKSSSIPGTFRVVHHKDPVPHVPLESMNFHHMPYEVFYVNDYSEWKICNFEGEDKTCSDQYAVDLQVENHLKYMGFDFTTNYLSCKL